MKKWYHIAGPVLLFGIAFVLHGCDVVEGGSIFLQPKEVVFRFEFSSDDLEVGQAVVIPATNSVDLGDDLLADGFSKGEVLSATVSSATLERINPIGVQMSFLSEVVVNLQVTGLSATTVARQSSLPDSRTAGLTIQPNINIANYVARSSFGSNISITPVEILANEDYVLELTLAIRIEVEGV